MVVTYKVNPIAALTIGPFLKVQHYAMVNIIAGRRVVPELYQFKARPELLAATAVDLIQGPRLEAMRRDLAEVRAKLGGPGASDRAAEAILRELP
jgi:lipid-A-disaccharide synthase